MVLCCRIRYINNEVEGDPYSREAKKVQEALDVHGSVHHNTDLIEMTNNMQLCRTIYYSIVP